MNQSIRQPEKSPVVYTTEVSHKVMECYKRYSNAIKYNYPQLTKMRAYLEFARACEVSGKKPLDVINKLN